MVTIILPAIDLVAGNVIGTIPIRFVRLYFYIITTDVLFIWYRSVFGARVHTNFKLSVVIGFIFISLPAGVAHAVPERRCSFWTLLNALLLNALS